MPDERLPQRTLTASIYVGAFLVLIFASRGEEAAACGYAIGAFLSLFSLASLTFSIRKFLTPGVPGAKIWLYLVTFLKLPFYATVLKLAFDTHFSAAPWFGFSVFLGVLLVPSVLVLKVIGYQLSLSMLPPLGDNTCRSKPKAYK